MPFQDIAPFSRPVRFTLKLAVLGYMIDGELAWRRVTEQLHPFKNRMRADAQTPGNLSNRIASLYDLMHRIALEIVAVITCLHVGLLASKLGTPQIKRAMVFLAANVRRCREEFAGAKERHLVEIY